MRTVKSLMLALAVTVSEVVAYINSDIIIGRRWLTALNLCATAFPGPFLMVGQRWDWFEPVPLSFREGWEDELKTVVTARGEAHNQFGIDFFAYRIGTFEEIRPFGLGRYCWDGWLLLDARRRGVPIIDISEFAGVIHQNHRERMSLQERQSVGSDPQRIENLRLCRGLVQLGDDTVPAALTSSTLVMGHDGKIGPRS